MSEITKTMVGGKTFDFSTYQGINDIFKNPTNRRDATLIRRLIDAVKKMLIHRYKSLEDAFKAFSEKGGLTQVHLDKMLKSIKINIDGRLVRTIHDKMLASGEKIVQFEDFQQCLMETTLQKLKKQLATYNRNHRRVRNNITSFIRTLVFRSEENMIAAVHRFQTKLTLKFSQRLWSIIRKRMGDSVFVTMAQFLSYVRGFNTYFHDYEFEFFEEIFKRVDRLKKQKVDVFHLLLFLVFISPETDKKVRFECVFKIFDTDDDGCLTQDQILKLYATIRLIVPILSEDEKISEANLFFNDELALQEGTRAFQFTMDLFRTKQASNLLTWHELWQIFEYAPYLVDNLIPSLHRIVWVLVDDIRDSSRAAQRIKMAKAAEKQGGKGGALAAATANLFVPSATSASSGTQALTGISAVAKVATQKPLVKSQSEIFSAGVKCAYQNALKGEWLFVPHTVEQIDNQEFLLWNKNSGLNNMVSPQDLGEKEAEKQASSGPEKQGSKQRAATKAKKEKEEKEKGEAGEGETEEKEKKEEEKAKQKMHKSASDPGFLKKQTEVSRIPAKMWGKEAFLRFSLYSLVQAKKKNKLQVPNAEDTTQSQQVNTLNAMDFFLVN